MTTKKPKKVTPEMAAFIKRARALGIGYVPIATCFEINQGRIADVMKGRLHPNVPPAPDLPPALAA